MTEPIIQYYEKDNLVKRIDATNDAEKVLFREKNLVLSN